MMYSLSWWLAICFIWARVNDMEESPGIKPNRSKNYAKVIKMDYLDIYMVYQPETEQWVKHERQGEGDLPPHTGTMAVMNGKGDSKFIWDAGNPVEVDAARKLFKGFKDKGMAAFTVIGDDYSKGTIVREFDPAMGALIFAPQLQGGSHDPV
jgi:hypothetical protein